MNVKLFLVIILAIVLFSLQASAVSLSSNGEVHTVTQGNLEFKTDGNGLVNLYKNGNYLARFGFTLKGTVNAQQKFLNSWETDWTWQVLSNTDSNVTVLGSTNWQGLDWKQRWFWSETEQKFTNYLTNNTGFDVTNTSFYYVVRLDAGNVECLHYVDNDEQGNKFCFEQDVTKTQNLEQYLKRINFVDTTFNFQDLIDSGFEFNYLFAGQLNNVNSSLFGNGFVIGVTKNGGLFPNGASVELDPSVIDTTALSLTNYGNVIVKDSSGNIFTVQEVVVNSSTDIFVSKSTDNGTTFTSFNLTNSPDVNESFPHIDVNSTDGLIIQFDGNNQNTIFVTTCSTGGCDSNSEFLDKLDVSACGATNCNFGSLDVDQNDVSQIVYVKGATGAYRRNTGYVGSAWGAEENTNVGTGVPVVATGIVSAKNGSDLRLAFANPNGSQFTVSYFDGATWSANLLLGNPNILTPASCFAGYDGNFYCAYAQRQGAAPAPANIHLTQCVETNDCSLIGNWTDVNVTESPNQNDSFVSMFQASDLNIHLLTSTRLSAADVNIHHYIRLPNGTFITSTIADGNLLFSDANRTYNPILRNRDYAGSALDGFTSFPVGNLTLDYVFLTSNVSTGDPSTLVFDSNLLGIVNGIKASITTKPASPITLDTENGITNVQTDFNSTTEFFGPITDINFLWQVDGEEISTDQNTVRDFNGSNNDFNVSLIVQGRITGGDTFTSQQDQNILLRNTLQGVDFNFTNNAFTNNVDVNFRVFADGTINFAVWGGTDFDTNSSGVNINKIFDQNKITQVCVIVNGTGDINKLLCKDYVVARWLVSPAIDEESGASLTPTITNYNNPNQTYTHSADINVFTFYGPEINYDTNAAFLIDFNTSYFTRNYFFDLDKNITFFLLQPRLPLVANSIQSTLFTIDNFTRDTVPEIVIQAIRTIAGEEVIVESTISDSTGTATMSFVANLDYTLRFLDADGTILSEGPLGPKSTVLYAFIGTAEINFVLTPVGELVIQWIPSTSSIDANTDFTVRFNQIINQVDLNITKLTVRISQGDTNFFVQDFNFTGIDTNIFQDVNVLDANEFSFMIVSITAQTPDGNFTKDFSYILVFTAGGSLVKNIQNMKSELGPTVVLIIAVIITLFVVAGFAMTATTDFNWLGVVALISLGVFTYFTWIPLTVFLVSILMGSAGLIYRWVR